VSQKQSAQVGGGLLLLPSGVARSAFRTRRSWFVDSSAYEPPRKAQDEQRTHEQPEEKRQQPGEHHDFVGFIYAANG
jgi:hypothetical protein